MFRLTLALCILIASSASAQDRSGAEAIIKGVTPSGTYIPANLDANGNIITVGDESSTPLSAFGEMLTVHMEPRVQVDAVYGMRSTDVDSGTVSGGTATASGGLFVAATGTNSAGESMIFSRRRVTYHAGQGNVVRGTAMFTTGVADSVQMFAAGNVEDAFGFGYDGASFGVLHRKGGKREIQTLTIDTVAGGAETATITIDGVADTCSVTATTKATNATESLSCSWTGWTTRQVGDTVVFLSNSTSDKTGTFSYATDGTGAGSFVETRAGVTVADTWTAQASWSEGALGYTLDPTMLNVYELQYQYLGAGAVYYRIENPDTGRFETVHILKYANANTTPSIGTPNLSLCVFAGNTGNTSSLTVKSASMAAFVQGKVNPQRNPESLTATKNLTDTLTNIVSFRNSTTFQSATNTLEFIPKAVSFANGSSTKNAIFEVYVGSTLGGTPNWASVASRSHVEQDTAGTTLTGGSLIGSAVFGPNGGGVVPLSDYNIRLEPGDVITIAGKTVSGTTDLTTAFTWVED